MTGQEESAGVGHPSRRRAAAWSLIFAYLGQAIAIVKGIVFVPLYLRYFSLDTYGAWLASANIVGILGLMDLGLSMVFYQQLGHAFGAGDKRRFASLAGAGALCMVGVVLAFVGLAVIIAPFMPGLVNASSAARDALVTTFVLVSASAALNLALTNIMAVTHAWQRTEIGGGARVIGQLVEITALYVALTRGLGLVALGVGALMGATASTALVLIAVVTHWPRLGLPRPTLERATLREVLATGIPVAGSRIASTVASNIEIALVAALLNPTLAAIYGITERIFRIALGFVNPIAGSVLSPLAHMVGDQGLAATRKVLAELSSLWAGVVAVVFPTLLFINRDFVGLWVGPEKYGGLLLTCAICASMIINSRLFLSVITLTSVGEIARTSWSTLVEPLVRLPLMVVALHLFGPIGLPLASIAGGAVLVFGLFPKFLAERVCGDRERVGFNQFAGHGAVAASFALSVVASSLFPRIPSWLHLAGAGALATCVTVAVALASPAIRRQSEQYFHRFRRRLT